MYTNNENIEYLFNLFAKLLYISTCAHFVCHEAAISLICSFVLCASYASDQIEGLIVYIQLKYVSLFSVH